MCILSHIQEEEILDLYNHPEPKKPFLFYHTQTGRTSTFESVAFPGSFIASSKSGEPIFLTSEQGKYYNINFSLDIGPWTQHRGRRLAGSLCLKNFIWSVVFSSWEVSRTSIISLHRRRSNKARCVLRNRWDGSRKRLSSKAAVVQAPKASCLRNRVLCHSV